MSEPGFWNDQERAQKISTEHARVARRLEMYERLRGDYDDAVGLLELEPGLETEIAAAAVPLRQELERLQEAALFDGEYDAGARHFFAASSRKSAAVFSLTGAAAAARP